MLDGRLRQALARLNPDLPPEALEDAYRKLTRPMRRRSIERNRAVHRMLVDGVTVEYRRQRRLDRRRAGAADRLRRSRRQRLAGGQPVHRGRGPAHRRPDVVVFVNGLPLAVIELKNAADENADIWAAFNQLQTYKRRSRRCSRPTRCWSSPTASQARIGSLGAGKEWFKPWRTITGRDERRRSLPSCR